MMERYRISHKLHVQHPFFEDAPCPLVVEPRPETAVAFRQHRLAWKRHGTNTWALVAPVADPWRSGEVGDLTFDVKPTSDLFYHVTPSSGASLLGSEGASLTPVGKEGVWSLLSFGFHPGNGEEALTLAFDEAARFWEYLVFPGALRDARLLQVREDAGKLTFTREGEVQFGDGRTAVRFVSTTPVPLHHRYTYRIKLWEEEEGAPLLLRHLDSPAADSRSIYGPEMITNYCNC